MRRLALRRFPDAIVRRRQGVGAFDEYGEWIQGQIVTVVLPASIQPVKLEDSDFAGGVSLVDRLKVYVPVGIERVVTPGDTLRWNGGVLAWNGGVLAWNGAPLMWGGPIGYRAGDENPLAAAFEAAGADEVEIGTTRYSVVESELWRGGHVRAILLRET